MAKWTAFPYDDTDYNVSAAALKKQWARLHVGDVEPLPKDAAVLAACNVWEDARHVPVRVVDKGSFPWSEHYSALQAEVPDAAEPSTLLDRPLLALLDRADLLLIAGQASSHCVKATVEHLVEHLPSRRPERLVLLADCMSPVAGFEPQATAFLAAMRAQGVQTLTQAQVANRMLAAAP